MKYLGIVMIIVFAGCHADFKTKSNDEAAASIPDIVYNGSNDKNENDNTTEVKSSSTINTLIDLFHYSAFDVEEYLTYNGYKQISTPISSELKIFKFKGDTSRTIKKAYGSEKYVNYTFNDPQLYKTIREHLNSSEFKRIDNHKNGLGSELYSSGKEEIELCGQGNGSYCIWVRPSHN
jgi:hypothetical protein